MRISKTVSGILARQSRGRIYAMALGLEGLIGWLDQATGPFVSFSAYYLLPITLVAWYGSGSAAYAMALLSAALRASIVSQIAQHHLMLLMVYNAAVTGALFTFVVYLIQQLRNTMSRLNQISTHDDLTKVANRRHFLELCTIEIENVLRQKIPLTLAFLDLDNFKSLNDSLGHQRGDELLISTAHSIHTRCSAVDPPQVCRP